MSETNPAVFNMNSCFTLASESKNERITFGAYNGSLTYIVNRSDGMKFTSKRVSQEYYICIKDAIAEVLKGVPGAVFPIIQNKFDVTTKKWTIDNVFTIGKDTNGIFYLEFKESDFAPVKFPFLGTKSLEFNGATSDGERSLRAFRGFNHFVNTTWPKTSLFTRNNLQNNFTKNGQAAKSKPASVGYSGSSSASVSASEDDIY